MLSSECDANGKEANTPKTRYNSNINWIPIGNGIEIGIGVGVELGLLNPRVRNKNQAQ